MGTESRSAQHSAAVAEHQKQLLALDEANRKRTEAVREKAFAAKASEQSRDVKQDLEDLGLDRMPIPEGVDLAEKTKILEASVAKRVDKLNGDPSLADDFKAWAMKRGSGIKQKVLMALTIVGLGFVGKESISQEPDTVQITTETFGPGGMSHETDGLKTSGDFRYQDTVAKDSVVNEFSTDGENEQDVMGIVDAIKNGAKLIELSATASREGRKNDTVAKDRTEAMYQLIAAEAAKQGVDISGVQFDFKSEGVNTEINGTTFTDDGLKKELQDITGKKDVDEAIRQHDRGNNVNPKLDPYLRNARSVKVKVSGMSLAPLAKGTTVTTTKVTPGKEKTVFHTLPVQQVATHEVFVGDKPVTPHEEHPKKSPVEPSKRKKGGGGGSGPGGGGGGGGNGGGSTREAARAGAHRLAKEHPQNTQGKNPSRKPIRGSRSGQGQGFRNLSGNH